MMTINRYLTHGCLAALTALAAPGSAQTIGPGAPPAGAIGRGAPATGFDAIGESFIAPGGQLSSFTFYVLAGSTGNVQFVVAPLAGTLVGAPLYQSASVGLSSGANVFANIGLATPTGGTYIAYLTNYNVSGGTTNGAVYAGDESLYANGLGYYNTTSNPTGASFLALSNDLYFSATFVPLAGGVPEASSWAMMIVGMGGVGVALRRRRVTTRVAFTA